VAYSLAAGPPGANVILGRREAAAIELPVLGKVRHEQIIHIFADVN
jgi:hypothetical protein